MVDYPKIFGIDLSLNHYAICQLDFASGICLDYQFLTTSKKFEKIDSLHSVLLPTNKDGANENNDELRKNRVMAYLIRYLQKKDPNGLSNVYISLEGYAYSAQTRSITQIAELTGYMKAMFWNLHCNLRIHDPLTVKLYATGKGVCLKKDIVEAAQNSDLTFPKELIKVTKKKTKNGYVEEYDGPATDISDAYFLADMLRTELLIRDGQLDLKKLPEQHRNIFLRVTKGYPVNILARPFVYKHEDI